jgi:hypothetical protein
MKTLTIKANISNPHLKFFPVDAPGTYFLKPKTTILSSLASLFKLIFSPHESFLAFFICLFAGIAEPEPQGAETFGRSRSRNEVYWLRVKIK